MHKKYQFIAILFLMIMYHCCAMELIPIEQSFLSQDDDYKCYWVARYVYKCSDKLDNTEKTKLDHFFQQESALSKRVQEYEKLMSDIEKEAEQFYNNFWDQKINEAYQNYYNLSDGARYEVVFWLEKKQSIIALSLNLPDVQRKTFSYVFEAEIPENFFKNQSITSVLNLYADDQDFFKSYKEKWLVINSRNCLKMGICQECIMFNYDHFLALPVDEKLLLGKIIKNNTVVIGNDITQLSEQQIYNIPSPYKITLAELPIAQKILEKQIECDVYVLYIGNDPMIKNKEDLAKQLKIDIEYDGPTIKDKILVIIPLLMNSILPHMILYGTEYGIEILVPGSGWLKWGLIMTGGALATAVSMISSGCIGNYLFPALD